VWSGPSREKSKPIKQNNYKTVINNLLLNNLSLFIRTTFTHSCLPFNIQTAIFFKLFLLNFLTNIKRRLKPFENQLGGWPWQHISKLSVEVDPLNSRFTNFLLSYRGSFVFLKKFFFQISLPMCSECSKKCWKNIFLENVCVCVCVCVCMYVCDTTDVVCGCSNFWKFWNIGLIFFNRKTITQRRFVLNLAMIS